MATRIGYPVVIRPSYVLGGRAMEIVHDASRRSRRYMAQRGQGLGQQPGADRPLSAGRDRGRCRRARRRRRRLHRRHHGAYRGGRHPFRRQRLLAAALFAAAPRSSTRSRARPRRWREALGVVGLMNVQYAVKDGTVYVLEVNPRASRTVPFVAKATGVPIAKIAARVMAGEKLADFAARQPRRAGTHVAVKEAVFPFARFPGVDLILGPGDEIDRRGDGPRLRFRPRLRQVAARRRRHPAARGHASSSRCATTTSRRWSSPAGGWSGWASS